MHRKTYHENVIPDTCPIHLAAMFPINQISHPDRVAWFLVEYDIAWAGVSVKSHGFRACIHYGWSVGVVSGGPM